MTGRALAARRPALAAASDMRRRFALRGALRRMGCGAPEPRRSPQIVRSSAASAAELRKALPRLSRRWARCGEWVAACLNRSAHCKSCGQAQPNCSRRCRAYRAAGRTAAQRPARLPSAQAAMQAAAWRMTPERRVHGRFHPKCPRVRPRGLSGRLSTRRAEPDPQRLSALSVRDCAA